MPIVLQMTKALATRPTVAAVPGVTLRHYQGADDMASWLALRDRAFAGEQPAVRPWTEREFHREFLEKSWWRSEAMWFAVNEQLIVGSVTLARRADDKPVVSWLMVDPNHRRRGIGQLLIDTLEAAVWDEGGKQIWLETHTAWEGAVALYRKLGYVNALMR